MRENFSRALQLVLKHEGGWADHPKDPGGATMKGVTLANFRRYVKPGATKDDLRKITDEQLKTVYKRYYWDAIQGDELPYGVDYAVFDFAVNSGPSRAAKSLQKVVGVKQDGVIGPATLAAVRTKNQKSVIELICADRMAFLKRLKTWGTFGKGWTSRVTGVLNEAIKMRPPEPSKPLVVDDPGVKPVVPVPVPTSGGWVSALASVLSSIFKRKTV